MKYLSIGLAALLLAAPLAQAAENPDVLRLSQRLQALDADPGTRRVAAYERLQARQALQVLAQARSSDRPVALKVAPARGEASDRQSVGWGKRVSVRVGLGGRRLIKDNS